MADDQRLSGRDPAAGPVPGPEEERWATRHGSFAPGVGADGRAARGPRPAPESAAELFARTRELPHRPVDADPPGKRLAVYDEGHVRPRLGPAMLAFVGMYVLMRFGLFAIVPDRDLPGMDLMMGGPVLVLVLLHQWLADSTRVGRSARWLIVAAAGLGFLALLVRFVLVTP